MSNITLQSALITMLLALSGSQASATIMTFDGILPKDVERLGPSVLPYMPKVYPDYSYRYTTPAGATIIGPSSYMTQAPDASNGSFFLRLTPFADLWIVASPTAAQNFSVTSIDMANMRFNNLGKEAVFSLTGYFADKTKLTQTFRFNNNNILTVNDFFTQNLSGFNNLRQFHINVTGAAGAVDNIVVNPTAVPEPASIALVALGLLGIVGRRRRTKEIDIKNWTA